MDRSIALPAVLDADVLVPMLLRDALLRLADMGVYRPLWTDRILEEMQRNIAKVHALPARQAEAIGRAMDSAFPEARIENCRPLEPLMRNHPKDRHVAAAAVKASASIIVTSNLKDFKDLPIGLQAWSPDRFLTELHLRQPALVMAVLASQAAAYRNPTHSLDDLLDRLSRTAPGFVHAARSGPGP